MDNHHLRVLLIEDNENDYRITRDLLRKVRSPRFDVEWVSTYDAGAEAVGRSQHDVVLLDDRLGQRSGLDLLRQVVGSGCQMPIIMLTATSDREADLKAMEAGAADYLEKDHLSARLLERAIRYVIEHKRVERALAAEHNLLRTLIDNIPDAVYVKDTEGRFILTNKTHLRYLGRATMEEVVGKTDFDLFPQQMAAKFYADEQAVIESGQPLINHEELTQDIASGTQFWAATSKSPLRDESGTVLGIVGVSHDLTRRKKMEEALAAERSLLRTLIDTVPVAIFTKDKASRFVLSNKAHLRILGAATMEEVVGKTDFDLFPQEMAAKFYADEQAIIQTGQPLPEDEERTMDLSTGEALWVATTKVPLRDDAGNVLGIVGITRDLTERKQAEDAVRASEARYRTLVHNLPGVIVMMFDRDLRYTLADGSALARHGYTRDFLEGKTLWEGLPPDRAAVYEPAFRAALAGQESSFETENRGFIYRVTVVPVRDDNGDVAAGLLVSEDITERKQTEERLAAERNMLRTLIDALPDYIFVKDRAGKFVLSNKAHALAVQVSNPDDLVGKTAADVFPSEMAAQFDADDQAIMQSGKPLFNVERQTIDAAGSPIWVTTTKVPLRDETGQVTGLVGISRDITERRQAEEAVRDSLTRYRLVARATNDVIWDWNLMADTIEWNEAIGNLFGYVPDQVAQEVSWWINHIHPDDQERLGERFAELINGEQTFWTEEHRFLKADGTYADVIDRGVIATDENGTPVRLIGSMIDITARKRAEEALRESEERYRLTFEQAGVGVAHNDHTGRFIWVNQKYCDILGYTLDELRQRTWQEVTHPDDLDKDWSQAQQLLAGDTSTYSLEKRYVRKDGSPVWVSMTTSLLRDSSGAVKHGIVVIEDISERKWAEEALRESEERFRILFEHSPDAIILLNPHDPLNEWPIVDCNEATCTMNGYTREELIGQPIDLLNPTRTDPALRADYFRRVREQGILKMEAQHRRKDGTLIDIQIHTSLVNLNGRELVLGIDRDISKRKQAEAALQESEERFRSTFEQVTVGMSLVIEGGRWMRVNRKLCEILGYTSDEMLGRTWMEMTHPDDLDEDWQQSRRLAAGEIDGYSVEKRFIRKDGTPVWTNMTTSLVRHPSGELNYGVAVIEDITARKQIEAALANERNLLRTLIDNLPDYIYVKDTEGRFITTNEAGWRGFGVPSLDDLIGRTDFDFLPHEIAEAHRVLEIEVLQNGRAVLNQEETTFELASGRYLWILTSKMPLRDSDGRIYGLVGISRDITERKQAVEALRESEEKFRQLAENVTQAFWLRDPAASQILYVSPAYETVLGRSRASYYENPQSFLEAIHPEDRERVEAGYKTRIKGGFDDQFRVVDPDGSVRWVWARTFPVFNVEGEIYRVVGLAEDITLRKQAEAQQIELAAERTRIGVVERFISDASHDLRTPLSIMQTSLWLLEKNADPEKRRHHADTLNEQITHITRVLEDFLNLGKLDVLSHADLRLEACDLSALVHAVRAEQQPLAAQKHHQMRLNLAADLPPIMADRAELERALRHLIVNAINFTPDNGTITLETRQDREHTVFEVRDNGIGIGPDDLPFIFERFYRADKARDISTGSSGLGLTIARKIIEAHGGRIEVESTPGEGSVFRVLL